MRLLWEKFLMKCAILLFFMITSARASIEKIHLSELNDVQSYQREVAKLSHLELFLNNINKISRNYQKLETRVGNKQIIGLELLIADTTNAHFESRWGHALFRFVDTNRKAGNDLTIGFVAQVDTPKLNYLKGLLGGYALIAEIKPLRSFHQQYAGAQERFLNRYLMSSTLKFRKNLAKQLTDQWLQYKVAFFKNLKKQKKKSLRRAQRFAKRQKATIQEIADKKHQTLGYRIIKDNKTIRLYPLKFKLPSYRLPKKYTFLGQNCSGAIASLFRNAGATHLPRISLNSIIPVRLDDFMTKHHLINFKLPKIPTIATKLNRLIEMTGQNYRSLKKMQRTELSAHINRHYSRLNDSELYIILDNFSLTETVFNQIISKLNFHLIPSYESIYKLQNEKSHLYKMCQSKKCALDLMSINHFTILSSKKKYDYSQRQTSTFTRKLIYQSELLDK